MKSYNICPFRYGLGLCIVHLSMLCRRGRGGRQGMGWALDCLCWPWGRAFDWSCSPRGGDIWIFLRPTWRYLTADSDEKDWDRTYVSHSHSSRMRRTVWKDLEIMEANKSKRKLGGFHYFVSKFSFVLACFWSIEPLKILWFQSNQVDFCKYNWSVYGSFATITVSL